MACTAFYGGGEGFYTSAKTSESVVGLLRLYVVLDPVLNQEGDVSLFARDPVFSEEPFERLVFVRREFHRQAERFFPFGRHIYDFSSHGTAVNFFHFSALNY